jgi:hypothetical protein
MMKTNVLMNCFVFIAQELTGTHGGSVDDYIRRMTDRLTELASYRPTFINAQTGSDVFSFDENCRVIDAALTVTAKTGVRILHETHRGRFSFHAPSLLPYLRRFPEMELTGDFSHFCAVSESLLQDQAFVIRQIIPHVAHLHARVGHEQGPQVPDPAAPEWQQHVSLFLAWWKEIVDFRRSQSASLFTITPEHGPAPYMPLAPYSRHPLGNQWDNNLYIVERLKAIIH